MVSCWPYNGSLNQDLSFIVLCLCPSPLSTTQFPLVLLPCPRSPPPPLLPFLFPPLPCSQFSQKILIHCSLKVTEHIELAMCQSRKVYAREASWTFSTLDFSFSFVLKWCSSLFVDIPFFSLTQLKSFGSFLFRSVYFHIIHSQRKASPSSIVFFNLCCIQISSKISSCYSKNILSSGLDLSSVVLGCVYVKTSPKILMLFTSESHF